MELEKINNFELKKLTNHGLIESTKKIVQKERELTLQVLECLREIEARKLHLARGYSSLHEFAVKVLGYSDGAAFRRIQAMRLTRDLPEVKKSIQEGNLSLSTASQAQRFFYSQKITKADDKKDLLEKIENKSTRETESFFAGLAPEMIRPEKERVLTETHTEVRIVIDQTLKAKLDKIKNLISHKHPNPSYAEFLDFLSDLALEKLDPEVKHQNTAKAQGAKVQKSLDQSPDQAQPARTASAGKHKTNELKLPVNGLGVKAIKKTCDSAQELKLTGELNLIGQRNLPGQLSKHKDKHTSTGQQNTTVFNGKPIQRTRHVPELLRRKIWVRDQGECQFIDPVTKRKCGSKKDLQIEHKRPFAAGGVHSERNLTLHCRNHNLYRAYQFYGESKIKRVVEVRRVRESVCQPN